MFKSAVTPMYTVLTFVVLRSPTRLLGTLRTALAAVIAGIDVIEIELLFLDSVDLVAAVS